MPAEIEPLEVGLIHVGDNPLRPLNDEEMKRLAVSMARIGLMTPISVRFHENVPSPDGECDDSYELIAGRHRLAAAISLGWQKIDAVEIKCSDVDARLWEISENLHRAELTKLQHDEQVTEWIRLTDEKVLSQVEKKPLGGRPEGGINAAARELGVDKNAAYRATKVASLSDEAKAAAVEHGLDDNRSALLEAAKEKEPEAQVAKLVARAGKPKAKPAPPIEDDVIGVDAPWIWRILPQEVTTFLEEHRQIHVRGRQPRWVTLATLKAAVLAGKTAGWFVADYNVETGAFLATYCASCEVKP